MYSEILILAMLRQRPQHGYELKKCIELALGGTVSLNNKVLYPALKHFEEMEVVVRHVVPQEGKPNRHIYHLTERGIELLHTYLCDFPPEQAANEAEFFTRVAFFEYGSSGVAVGGSISRACATATDSAESSHVLPLSDWTLPDAKALAHLDPA